MLFNSYEFVFLFLPIVLCAYFRLSFYGRTQGHLFLVFASLFFYGWWNPNYLTLILFSVCMNFTLGKYCIRVGHRFWLFMGVALNLVLLGYYKYMDFFIQNVNVLFQTNYVLHHLVLPLGISFFTFTQIAYLVETYRGKVYQHHFLSYILFVTYFPHLLAGPIIHYENMMPQFLNRSLQKVNYDNIVRGLFLFSVGLCKKVLIADSLAEWANAGFAAANVTSLTILEAWATSLSYTFQLYFDFSGYTDMALGVSLMLNIKLPINFNSPYKASSIIDFWRRWHITLSHFLRDYLYIPLGGNRKGAIRKLANILSTMLLGGLWHGAGWTFVLWGGIHGIALVFNHVFRQIGGRLPVWISIPLTFFVVNLAWVFFRADDFSHAFNLIFSMFTSQGFMVDISGSSLALPWGRKEIVVLAAFLLVAWFSPNSNQLTEKFSFRYPWAIAVGVLLLVAVMNLNRITTFLYYQF